MVSSSALERTFRLDAEFFRREFLESEARLKIHNPEPMTDSVSVSDGNHFTIRDEFVEEGGLPYFRGQDVSGELFLDGMASARISDEAFHRKYMRRSHLAKGDVLLSIVGTIGSTGLIDSDEPATCSCKLAIFRPKNIDPAYLAIFLRSRFGALRIEQLTRGAVQRGLILDDMDQVRVARFGTLEPKVVATVAAAKAARDAAGAAQRRAENTLLDALGLRGWSPPEPLTYTRSANHARAAGRLDAQFHAPTVTELHARLAAHFKLITFDKPGEVINGRTVAYAEDGTVPMIRSGDVGKRLERASLLRAHVNQPIVYVRKGDVLISSIGFGSIGRVHVVRDNLVTGTVSEVTVIRQSRLEPDYLTAFLRSSYGQMQIERFITGATGQLHLYPRDVRSIFVPVLNDEAQAEFSALAATQEQWFARSRALLAAAVRAVEIAVEDGEATALTWLTCAWELADAAAA